MMESRNQLFGCSLDLAWRLSCTQLAQAQMQQHFSCPVDVPFPLSSGEDGKVWLKTVNETGICKAKMSCRGKETWKPYAGTVK